ncbi:EcsC family protein [Vreelandella massiliensis]|uniref:EcsC family protein n=1 Tax=Vreelandella massiliensis TaxID=1816686 RepID=UPI00096AAB45|nr:EcsC family protein [Halomonas massiliensis]
MSEKLTQSKMMKALDWTYDKAIEGIPGFDSAEDLAENYKKSDDLVACTNSLIRWQNAKTGTTGFVSGLGGVITMPVAIPASIASLLYVQIRMVAAIAYLGGYDVRDDRVRSLVYVCLTGSAAKDIVKEAGINIGTRLTVSMIKKIPATVTTKINQKVGFRLVTKFGSKGAVNLGKMVPLVGGIIGGTFDSVSTNIVGNVARKTFIEQAPVEGMSADQHGGGTMDEKIIEEEAVEEAEEVVGVEIDANALDESDEILILNGFSPRLKDLWDTVLGPVAVDVINDEEQFKRLASSLYASLPMPLSSLVKKENFVAWCYENRQIFNVKKEEDIKDSSTQ